MRSRKVRPLALRFLRFDLAPRSRGRPERPTECASRSSSHPPPLGHCPAPLPAVASTSTPQAVRRLPARPARRRTRRRHARAKCSTSSSTARTSPRASARRTARSSSGTSPSRSSTSPRRPRGKATVRFYDEPWEICVERFGATACLSVYRAGPEPLVAVYDRAVALRRRRRVRARRDRPRPLDGEPEPAPAGRARARVGRRRSSTPLAPGRDVADARSRPRAASPSSSSPSATRRSSFGAEFAIREGAPAADDGRETVERADLHALLFRGRVRAEIRGRAVDLGECHPVLVAERLVELARRAFDAWERGLPFHARGEAAGVSVGVRVSRRRRARADPGRRRRARRDARSTRSRRSASPTSSRRRSPSAARSSAPSCGAIARSPRTCASARCGATLRESTEALREANQSDSKVNPTPEPYRAFAAALDEASAAAQRSAQRVDAPAASASPLRAPLARDRPGHRPPRDVPLRRPHHRRRRHRDVGARSRDSGRVLWRADVTARHERRHPRRHRAPRARRHTSPSTTSAPARRRCARASRRASAAPVAGAVVHLPGLPRLVVVTEGEHHLVAIDLTTGEPRWRWSWGVARGPARAAARRA